MVGKLPIYVVHMVILGISERGNHVLTMDVVSCRDGRRAPSGARCFNIFNGKMMINHNIFWGNCILFRRTHMSWMFFMLMIQFNGPYVESDGVFQ